MSVPPKPWLGIGLRARAALRAEPRACALRLCVTAGLRLIPIEHPHETRLGRDVAIDLSLQPRDARGGVAIALASMLIERENLALDLDQLNQALADVALELILPADELERVWAEQDGNVEAVDRVYSAHVPSSWVLRLAETLEL